MTINYVDEVSEQLPATDTTIYTAPTNVKEAIITKCLVCCEDATGDSFTVNIVQSGGSVGVTNQYIQSQGVNAGENYEASELVNLVLKPGDFVSAIAATADRLNFKLSVRERT